MVALKKKNAEAKPEKELDPFDVLVGEKIREARESKVPKISQSKLAKAIGYESNTAIYLIETGQRGCERGTLKKIANYLGVDFDYLNSEEPLNKSHKNRKTVNYAKVIDWDQISLVSAINDFDVIPVWFNVSKEAFALTVFDESMQSNGPVSFPKGSLIIVDPKAIPKNQDFVIVSITKPSRRPSHAFKKLVSDGIQTHLLSLDKTAPLYEFTENMKIVGVVVGMLMKV